MIRKRNILISAIILILIFIFTTNYLLINLNNTENEVKLKNSVAEKIYIELKNLPESYKKKSLLENYRIDEIIKTIKDEKNVIDISYLWKETNSWVTKTQITDFNSKHLGSVLFALKNGKITKADIDTRGTQLKLLLTLEGDQNVIFKPKWYDKEKIIEGPVYAGKDRYGSELVAFYLSILLNMPLTPISTERELSFKTDILPVATKRLSNTSFLRNNRVCIYGKCYYCKREDPICENEKNHVTGAVILNVKTALRSHRSPWQRTYKTGKKALWEESEDYCRKVREKLTKKRIYDLIDTSIFDFLIQNGDRHHYETFGDSVALIDNGKGLGNPNVHHIDILAPLYQCCILRKETWKTLLSLSGGTLRERLLQMPNINNFLTEAHLKAIEHRLLLIFATMEYCKKHKREEHNLL